MRYVHCTACEYTQVCFNRFPSGVFSKVNMNDEVNPSDEKVGKSYFCGILLQIDIVLCFPISRQGMNKFYKNSDIYLYPLQQYILNFSQQKDHSELCNKNHLGKKGKEILFVLKCFTIVILMTFVNQQEKCVQPKKKEGEIVSRSLHYFLSFLHFSGFFIY